MKLVPLYDIENQMPIIGFGGNLYRFNSSEEVTNPAITPLPISTPFAMWHMAGKQVKTNTTGTVYMWSKVSGPGTVSFDSSMIAQPIVNVTLPGTYVLNCLIDAVTNEQVVLYAVDETELRTVTLGYLKSPSTIPANHGFHPAGAFVHGQVSLANLTSTALAPVQPPSLGGATNVETGDNLQAKIDAASNGDVLYVKGTRVFDQLTVNFGTKNLSVVCDPTVTFTDCAIRGTGVVKIWNAKFDGYDSAVEQDPMVRFGAGSMLIHCDLRNAEWRNLALESNLECWYCWLYRGGVYNFSGSEKDSPVFKYCRFEQGNYGLITEPNALLANGKLKHKVDFAAGNCKLSKGSNALFFACDFVDNYGADVWLDYRNTNALIQLCAFRGTLPITDANNKTDYASVSMEWNNIGGAVGRNITELCIFENKKEWVMHVRDGAGVFRYNVVIDCELPYNVDSSSRMGAGEVTESEIEYYGNTIYHTIAVDGEFKGLFRLRENNNGANVHAKLSISGDNIHLLTGSEATVYTKWVERNTAAANETATTWAARPEIDVTLTFDQ